MELHILSPAKKQESDGTTIFKALLDRQKFISAHLENGGTIKELKEMGLKFGKVDLRDNASSGH